MKDKAEFIVKVLLNHPFEGDDDPQIEIAKTTIRKRYREIRRTMSFTQAEIQAKTEWLTEFLQMIS